jgi:hypothetical protein
MEGSSHGLIEVLPRADLEGLANCYEIFMICQLFILRLLLRNIY